MHHPHHPLSARGRALCRRRIKRWTNIMGRPGENDVNIWDNGIINLAFFFNDFDL
jgi:hypothetical protein